MTRIRGRVGAVAAAMLILAFVLALAACGGGGGESEEVASLKGSSGSPKAGSTRTNKDPQAAALDFAKCMREHGVDMPDPDADGGFQLTPDIQGDPEDFRKAEQACGNAVQGRPGGALPADKLSPEDQAALQEGLLAFAKCMRARGIEIPDPSSSGSRGFAVELPKGSSPDDPEFKEAQKACEPTLREAQRKAGLEPPGAGG